MTTPELPGVGSQQTAPHQQQQSSLAQQDHGAPTQTPLPEPTKAKKPRNVLGLIALITAALGFIFACIPGALIVGWILLPIAFVLALVSLFIKDKAKWMGITALIVSIVGTIVGFAVFFSVLATSVDDAIGSGDTKVVQPSSAASDTGAAAAEKPAANAGTRDNPHPIGSVIESDDWRVVINSVTLAATDAVVAANQFNDPPAAGSEYILVNYSATFVGDDPNGQVPAFVSIDYVTAEGKTVDTLDNYAVAPEAIDTMSTLYTGATAAGNKVIAVPIATAGQGVLAVRPGMLADKVFVAVK